MVAKRVLIITRLRFFVLQVDLPSEEVARSVAARAICIKGIFEPWGSGSNAEECWRAVADYPMERREPFLAEDSTFKINVLAYGRSMPADETKAVVENCFQHVDFKGKVLMDRCKKGARSTLPSACLGPE